jgi:hypothetical protein
MLLRSVWGREEKGKQGWMKEKFNGHAGLWNWNDLSKKYQVGTKEHSVYSLCKEPQLLRRGHDLREYNSVQLRLPL